MVRATRVRKHKRNKPVSNGTCNVSAHIRKLKSLKGKVKRVNGRNLDMLQILIEGMEEDIDNLDDAGKISGSEFEELAQSVVDIRQNNIPKFKEDTKKLLNEFK